MSAASCLPVRVPASPRPGLTAVNPLPLGLGLLFFLVSAGFAVAQHLTFHTRARDMGIYIQALWSAAQGRPFLSSLFQENTNHLAEHVAPSLWPLVPLAGLAPDAVPLVVLQQLFLAACGIPLYLVARVRLGRWPGMAVLLGFYLMPAVSRASLSEFHPIVLAALPVAAAVACALAGWPRSAALLLLFALLFEEEAAPTVAGLGAMLGLRLLPLPAGSRNLGATLVAVAALWLALTAFVVMPGFRLRLPAGRGEATNRAVSHYDQVRQNPAVVWGWLTAERGPDALAWLLLPNGGLALLAPQVLAINLPSFAALFLQDRAGTYAGHWSAPLLPVVWLAAAVGLGRFMRRPPLLRGGLALQLGGLALAYSLDSSFPGGRQYEPDHFQTTELEADLRRAVNLVPPQASLAATRRVVPQLAARRELYQYPFSFYDPPLRPDAQRPDFYILDLTDSPTRRVVEAGETDSLLQKGPGYDVQRFGPNVLLLTRNR